MPDAYPGWWKKIQIGFNSEYEPLVPTGKKVFRLESGYSNTSIQQYEYIILSQKLFDQLQDHQAFLDNLKKNMHSDTRLIFKTYSSWFHTIHNFFLWISGSPAIISYREQERIFSLAGFQVIARHHTQLLPFYIPIFTWIINIFGQLPVFNRLCLSRDIVFRLLPDTQVEYVVSVVIPCKNEMGNIERAVRDIPEMGKATEIIFVEGSSSDGTYEELQRVQQQYPQKTIKIFRQNGRGKKDAVKMGFTHASGDILMILDADLTVEPQALKEFYAAIKAGNGEFLNGSRLVYPMEKNAMQWGAYFANHGIGHCLSWLLNQKIKDTLCGTKVFFAKDYRKISTINKLVGDLDPFGDFDLLFGAAYHNLKITDVPVHYKSRRYGSSQISRYRHVWFLIAMGIRGIKEFKLRHGK